jgi:LmbE family N-acetylglucosaminyl deacetylase
MLPDDVEAPDIDERGLGVPGSRITTTVDVSDYVDKKRASMAAHASQITDTHFFLAMPDDAFRTGFSAEWFIRIGAPEGTVDEFFAGLK